MLALLQWLVSRLSVFSDKFSKLVRSEPRLLVKGGVYRDNVLADERVTAAEVDAAIRNAGVGRIEDVAAVVLESDGSMSVIVRGDEEMTALRSVRF